MRHSSWPLRHNSILSLPPMSFLSHYTLRSLYAIRRAANCNSTPSHQPPARHPRKRHQGYNCICRLVFIWCSQPTHPSVSFHLITFSRHVVSDSLYSTSLPPFPLLQPLLFYVRSIRFEIRAKANSSSVETLQFKWNVAHLYNLYQWISSVVDSRVINHHRLEFTSCWICI